MGWMDGWMEDEMRYADGFLGCCCAARSECIKFNARVVTLLLYCFVQAHAIYRVRRLGVTYAISTLRTIARDMCDCFSQHEQG